MEQYVDVSNLEPPEPMEVILDAIADLSPGDYLKVMHRRNPVPLYRMLHDMGYEYAMHNPAPEQFEIFIWPKDMAPPIGATPSTGNIV